jgi:phosphoserine phosphatase
MQGRFWVKNKKSGKNYAVQINGINGADVVFDLDGTLVFGDLGESVFYRILIGSLVEIDKSNFNQETAEVDEDARGNMSLLIDYISLNEDRKFLRACQYVARTVSELPTAKIQKITLDIINQKCMPKHICLKTKDLNKPLRIRYGVALKDRAIQLMRRFEKKGARVWVVSASPQPVVEAFGNYVGLPKAQIVATQVDTRQKAILRSPYGEGKVSALKELGVQDPLVVFGNSLGDLAILEKAKYPFVMDNSSKDLMSIAKERGWTVYFPGLELGLF